MKRAIILLLALSVVGCGKEIIKVEYREKLVPVNATPTPPVVTRPEMAGSKLTAEDRKDIGIVAKAVAVDLSAMKEYSAILESIIDKYRVLSNESKVKQELDVSDLNLEKYKAVESKEN